MKKTVCAFLSLLILTALFSCGKTNEKNSVETQNNNQTTSAGDEAYVIQGPSIQEGLEYDYDNLSDFVNVCDYRNLTVKVKKIEATEAEINSMINSALEKAGESKAVTDRGAAAGDTVTFTGKGVFNDDKDTFNISEETNITIGKGKEQGFATGFDECFIGAKQGTEFSFVYKYPDDYSHDKFAGRTVSFTMNISSVQIINPAELNDEFVKSLKLDSVNTVDEYKEYCRNVIEQYSGQQNKQSVQNEIFSALLENSTVKKYPEKEIECYISLQDAKCQSYASASAVSVEQYKTDKYGSVEAYEKQTLQEAQDSVKKDLIINLIARELNIEVNEEEYEQALRYGYENLGKKSGMGDLSDFEKTYSSDITSGLLTLGVLDELYNTVNVIYE